MKKNYESPKTEYVELDTQNVLLASFTGDNTNREKPKNSVDTPIDNNWD